MLQTILIFGLFLIQLIKLLIELNRKYKQHILQRSAEINRRNRNVRVILREREQRRRQRQVD